MITIWGVFKMLCGLLSTIKIMGNILVLWAVTFYMAALLVGMFTNHSWKNVAIFWGLLAVGSVFFGIALTL